MSADRLPTLARLTEDIADAMLAAERAGSHRWKGWRRTTAVGLVAFVAAVPAVAAVRGAVLGEAEVALPTRLAPTQEAGPQSESGFVVARGRAEGLAWALAVRRCQLDGVVTFATATLIGRTLDEAGLGANFCPRGLSGAPARRQPVLDLSSSSTGGISVLWTIVPERVTSLELRLLRRVPTGQGAPVLRPAGAVRVATRPLDPIAVRRGRLPQGYRLAVVTRRGDATYSRAIARDARRRVVRDCVIRRCDSLARRGR